MQEKEAAYEVIWLVRRLFRSLARESTDGLEDLGITAADRAVLEFLYPDASLSVPGIAERYQVSRQHVQVTVNRLLAADLVETRPNPRHRRSPLALLTPAGRRLFRRIRRREGKRVADLFAAIPDEDLGATRRTLAALYAGLNDGDMQ